LLGSFLGAWLLFPLVLLLLSLGCGLLVRIAAGGALRDILVLPVGFALVVAICSALTTYGWLVASAAPVLVVAAASGLALSRSSWCRLPPRLRRWFWPALACLVAFAAVGGPVFLTGSVGWAGYTRIVDIAFQFDFAEHLASAGRVNPSGASSSYNIVTAKLLGIGYPGGAQATLGVVAKLIGTNLAWCYQALLAFTAAMGALAVFSALGAITSSRAFRCMAAAVAIQPNVLYGYTLEAGIKELSTAALLMVLVATLVERLPGRDRPRSLVPAAVAASGAFATFSLGVLPWLGVLVAVLFVVSVARRGTRKSALAGWTTFAAIAALISLPGLITALKLIGVAKSAVGGVVDLGLGNLAAPVSRWSSAGVWLTGDYRYPIAHPTASHVFDILAIALAAIGLTAALARRRWPLAAAAAAAGIALYYYVEHTTAWLQFKAFTVTAVFTLLIAFVGAAALQSSRSRVLRVLGWSVALVLAGAVLYGNALIYHDTSLAPGARYRDLAAIGGRYRGQGPALDPTFDEYAEFFLRGEKATTIVDPANFTFRVRSGVTLPAGEMSFGWDLNQLELPYLESFPLIILPRNPIASRAPSNYELAQQTSYFDVWRRVRPARTVIEHFPLSGLAHERSARYCQRVVQMARRAGPGSEIAYTLPPTGVVVNPLDTTHPSYWRALGPADISTPGAGTLKAVLRAPIASHYSVWIEGSIGRPLTLYVDGRRVGSVGYEERYPGQFVHVGQLPLSAGSHTLELVRGNGTLHPGSGDPESDLIGRTLGAIVMTADSAPPQVHVAPARDAAKICAAPVGYQWIELLKVGGAPPDALRTEG
jgi:hypothetical protein